MNFRERLDAARMSESERQQALAALQNAERVCELATRVAGAIAALRAAKMGTDTFSRSGEPE